MAYPDGASIRRYRIAKGWTEKELLTQCNRSSDPGKITKQMLSRMETGKIGYAPEWALRRVAAALGVRRVHIALFAARTEAVDALATVPQMEKEYLRELLKAPGDTVEELARRTGRLMFATTEKEWAGLRRYWEKQKQSPEHLALRFLSERIVLVNAARLGGPLPYGSTLSDLAKPVYAQLTAELHKGCTFYDPQSDLQRTPDRQALAEQIRTKVASKGRSGTGALALTVWERQTADASPAGSVSSAERRRAIERIRAAIGRLLKGARCHPEARILQQLADVFGILPSQLLRLTKTTRELIALPADAHVPKTVGKRGKKDGVLGLEEIRPLAESTYALLAPRPPNEHFCWLTGDVGYWAEQPPEQRAAPRLRACLLAIQTVLENAARKKLIICEMEQMTFLRELACEDILAHATQRL